MTGASGPKPAPQEPSPGFIAVGLIRAARGVRGELRVETLTKVEGRYAPGAELYVQGTCHTVERARTDRHGLLLTLADVKTRDEAEGLRGALLEVPESESPVLAADSYYHHQIIGLAVRDVAGTELGSIEEVLETGANDVFVVRSASGETLIPALDSVVKLVDIDKGLMVVDLIEGLEPNRAVGHRRPRASKTPPRLDR